MTSKYSPYSQSRRTEKTETLVALSSILTTGGIVAAVTLTESSRPEAVIGGEEELVDTNEQ